MSKENKKEKELNYFEVLNSIDVSDKIEKKNGLSYLSWSFAWSEIKKRYPNVKKNVVKNDKGWLYHTDGRTCWVEVSVSINDIEEIEYLPVMDYKNQAIPLERVTSMNVNTAIQRALTKAIARHGLGLYIYAGEDLPDNQLEKAAQAAAEDMQQIQREENEKQFIRIKEAIESCGSVEEVEGLIEKEKKEINKLGKYAKDLFDLLKDSKEAMIKILDPENNE